ncbi:MAG: extracellular solute-binding protein [Cellulosilyticaceae bacterium]
MRMLKKAMSVFLAGSLLVVGSVGCSPTTIDESKKGASVEDATEDATPLTIGLLNLRLSGRDDQEDTTLIDEIEKQLGVDLQGINLDNEKFNLLLASGDLPDILMMYPEHLEQVLQAGYAVPLDGYLEEYGKNISQFEFRNNLMREKYSNGTGKLYFHTPSSGVELPNGPTELYYGYKVRWDLYKEIGMPTISNDQEFIDALKKMKTIYPVTETGEPVYAMSVYNDMGIHGWSIRAMTCYGYKQASIGNLHYVIDVRTNDVVNNFVDYEGNSPFWIDMKFYNTLYREGLLDPDAFITKGEDMIEKADKGQYLSDGSGWYLGNFYSNNREKDPDTMKGYMTLPAEAGWYGSDFRSGWVNKLYFVTSECENPEKAVAFLDFLDSPDGNRLAYSGIQGVHWDYDEAGEPYIFEETLNMKTTPEWKNTGIGKWQNIVGMSPDNLHPDGNPYSLFSKEQYRIEGLNPIQKDYSQVMGVDYPSQVHQNMVKEGKGYDHSTLNTDIDAIMPSVPSDIKRIMSKCEEIAISYVPAIVGAQTDEAFIKNKDALIEALNKANQQKAWEWFETNWNQSKAQVESLGK